MKKLIIATVLTVAACGLVFAQNSNIEAPNPENVGNDSAMEALREISVDKFEREGAWNVHMSPDYGTISARLFDGSPAMKEPLPEDKDKKDEDTQVLGVKVEFFKRGVNSFYIMSERPLPIEGITKTISVWVCGRNQAHDLYILVQDYFGNNFELYMGNLGFSGWKKLTAVVSPSYDGVHGIVQHSAYYGDRPGLRILGFRVDCDPMLARGSYYMYMDDLRAVTDLYDMENHDEDDMADNW
ncbi:MAG: flagellar filament outer layer protein FlaA [Treponema sp.]